MFDRNHPYNDLPPLPPQSDIESKAILKLCVESRTALGELKFAGKLIPNQSVLINTIPLLEAQLSSEIENIVTTTDRLFQSARSGDQSTDPATKEALCYRTALLTGYRQMATRPISISMAKEICSTIKGHQITTRVGPGTALAKQPSGEIIYTPPVGMDVLNALLTNWEQFLHDEAYRQIDPLVRMAIGHYQFEAIHPFPDGNGRTGRILNILFLIQEKVLEIPVLYLSRYFLKYRSEYYSSIRNVTEHGQWEPWILFVLNALGKMAQWTMHKIISIRDLMENTKNHVQRQRPRIYSHELVTLIFTQPYCRITDLEEQNIAKRQTASRYLKSLIDIGILKEITVGREKVFIHSKFLDLLTADENTFLPYGE